MTVRTRTDRARRIDRMLSPVVQGKPLLQVRDMCVTVDSRKQSYDVVHNVSLDVIAGEVLGIVGESGCGKSVTMGAVTDLLPPGVRRSTGTVTFRGVDLSKCDRATWEQLRGGSISMVFQDPMAALDPLYTVGDQMVETIRKHMGLRGVRAREVAVEYLRRVGLSEPEKRMRQYPFELSGGMRQRVVIAIALCCSPNLLICDEPTTALDVTIQAKVLDLIRTLHEQLGNSVVFISHNMGVIASVCDRVAVMYGGRVVERGDVRQIFHSTAHPYTRGLLACMPTLEGDRSDPLIPIPGTVPDPRAIPAGCPFAPRCSERMSVCLREIPPEFALAEGHACACWRCLQREELGGHGAAATERATRTEEAHA
jgi:peptide/nickel transport system ATP-binding protein